MDKKQLSQLDPKLKAVYDRVMGIANTTPPPPAVGQPMQPPAPPPTPFPIQAPTNQMPGAATPMSNPLPELSATPGGPATSLPPIPATPGMVAGINANPATPPLPPPPPVAGASAAQTQPALGPEPVQPTIQFTSGSGPVPTMREQTPAGNPPMQAMNATVPVSPLALSSQQPLVHTQSSGKGFMIVFIVLGIIFFALYAVFWIQLFHLGIPPFS